MGSLFSSSSPKIEPILHSLTSAQLHQIAEFKHAKDIIPIAKNVMKSVNRMGETSTQTIQFANSALQNGEELASLSLALKANKGDTASINRAKVIIEILVGKIKYQLAASLATSDTLNQSSVQMRNFSTEFATLLTAVNSCNSLLGQWRSEWYTICGELQKAIEGLNSIDPAGALFRLFPDVKLDVFRKQMDTIIKDANDSLQLVPKVNKSLQDSIEAACNVHITIGPYGGNGGGAFADPEHNYRDALTKIIVYSGDDIDSFQCFYTSGNGNRHGGGGGRPSQLDLQNGENILRITGTFDKYLMSIGFTSSTGRSWNFGNKRGRNAFDVSAEGGVLQSIKGRSGTLMDQISFVFTTAPHFDAYFGEPALKAHTESKMVISGMTGSAASSILEPVIQGLASTAADIDYSQYLLKV